MALEIYHIDIEPLNVAANNTMKRKMDRLPLKTNADQQRSLKYNALTQSETPMSLMPPLPITTNNNDDVTVQSSQLELGKHIIFHLKVQTHTKTECKAN
eukprot:250784_1